MKKIQYVFTLIAAGIMGLALAACSEDNLDTNQYRGGVSLNAYGPNPVMRGGTLRFVGSNLDQIASIQIPGTAAITSYETVKAGVPSEIRVTVPKDGPTEGVVTLTTKDNQTLTTQTSLTYTEPIEIEGFTPATAMPGDVVTIKGDYLNLIHSIAFAEDVVIGENDFESHDRYTISVTVPEEAQTGKIELYTTDLTVASEEELDYQIVTSDDAIEIGLPTISKLKGRSEAEAQGEITAKAGETITITGTYFTVTDDVTIGGVSAADLKISNDGTGIIFTLPAEAPDGEVTLVCKSGVEVPAGTLVTVKPTNGTAAPNPVKAGAALTVSGADMDVVAAVSFPIQDGEAVEGGEIEVAADKVVVKAVPETAVDGNLSLVMANGLTVEVPFTLVKPTVTGYDNSSVSAGGALTIQGTDLDLVKTVQFGDGSDIVIVENATAEAIALSVPMNALTGSPVLTLANGTTVQDVPQVNIEEAVFCYATALPADDAELKAGESLTLTVANGDKLTGVQIGGTDCQYVLVKNNTELIIGIPDNAGPASKVRLVSSNGEITYTIDFIPNTEVTTVLWTGTIDLNAWSINWQIGDGTAGANNPRMFADMDLQEGDIIRVYATNYNDWWQVQFFDGHWGGQTEIGVATGLNNGNNINSGIYSLEEHGGAIEIPVTATLKEQLTTLTDWGYCWIMQGEGVVITKIAVTHYVSLETTVWQGEVKADNWGDQPYILSDGGTELLAAGMKVGSTIRVYITPMEDAWNCQIVDGHWSPNTAFDGCDFNNGNWDLSAHKGALEFVVTDFIYEHITTSGGWGGSFLLNGDNVICTKVTIE